MVAAVLVLLADQATKAWVLARMEFGASLPLVPPLVRITLWRNTGIAFGLLSGANELVALAAVAAAVWLVLYHRDRWQLRVVRVGTGMVLGGAVGNLVDRVRFGYVVDFLELPYWPIFNVADACIVTGGVLLILSSLRSGRRP